MKTIDYLQRSTLYRKLLYGPYGDFARVYAARLSDDDLAHQGTWRSLSLFRLNDIDAQIYLADVFARIADIPQSRLHELLPWGWAAARAPKLQEAA